mmetsp:Transcript_49866/g.98268  ORF Transcript_49866/g.98268 Transcript_49866/m.98268 type:complete len:119 (+) Transcript_49866:372-728(+)
MNPFTKKRSPNSHPSSALPAGLPFFQIQSDRLENNFLSFFPLPFDLLIILVTKSSCELSLSFSLSKRLLTKKPCATRTDIRSTSLAHLKRMRIPASPLQNNTHKRRILTPPHRLFKHY